MIFFPDIESLKGKTTQQKNQMVWEVVELLSPKKMKQYPRFTMSIDVLSMLVSIF
jgi:hypothetical protein